jgi:aminoglycoside phosphotransferase family enzyme
MQPADLIAELTRPAAYAPQLVARVEVLQTHTAFLFLTEERVYKVKKPVDLGFLDFTTLERREHFCREEVRLNSRLSPQVYLGVVPITVGPHGRLRVGADGEPVEWAVEMVRLPAHRMLSRLLESGEIDNAHMNAVVDMLAAFHAGTATGEGVDAFGAPEQVRANAIENLAQLAPFVGAPDDARAVLTPVQLGFLRERTEASLARHAELVERRVVEGRIREGHGDLHAENVCFPADEPVAYDCIEFAKRFRCCDVASDLAFLAMDLDFRGFGAFSSYLVHRYAEATGDHELPHLIGFYKGYRALVRAKVAALTASDPTVGADAAAEQRTRAMRYVQLAASYELEPTLTLMCGLPGAGKSWLAHRIAPTLRAALFRSDVRRDALVGAAAAHTETAHGRGAFTQDERGRVYRVLLLDAIDKLHAGRSVIVDATCSRRAFRRDFVDAAERLGLPYQVLHVTAPDAVVRARLEARALDPDEVSAAGVAVYEREREAFEPPDELPEGHVLLIDSSTGSPEEHGSRIVDHMIALAARAEETRP